MRAFQLAGDSAFADELPPYQPQKLYYHLFPKGMLRWAVRLLPLFGKDPHRFGKNGDIDLLSIVEEGEFPVHASIDYHAVDEQRQAASACHASQLGGMPQRGPLAWLMRRGRPRGPVYARHARGAMGKVRERDLFEGVG